MLLGGCQTPGCPSSASELTVDAAGGLHAMCPWCAAEAMEGHVPAMTSVPRAGRLVTVSGSGPVRRDRRPAVNLCLSARPSPEPRIVVDQDDLMNFALASCAVLAGAGVTGCAASWANGPLAVAPWCAATAVGAGLGWLIARVRRRLA